MLYSQEGKPVSSIIGSCLSFRGFGNTLRIYRDREKVTPLRWPDLQEERLAPFALTDASGRMTDGCAELAMMFADCAGHRIEVVRSHGRNVVYKLFGTKHDRFRTKDGRRTSVRGGHWIRLNEGGALMILDQDQQPLRWNDGADQRTIHWMDLSSEGARDFLVNTIIAGIPLHAQQIRSMTVRGSTDHLYLLVAPE